jgi:23S rRNA pseudouridine1911/1915/1917 synthase
VTNRTFTVGRSEAGRPLGDWLRQRLALSAGEARQLVRGRHVRLAGVPCLDPGRRLQRGQRIDVRLPDRTRAKPRPKEQPAAADFLRSLPEPPRICYVDDQVVVVDKPAGLTTMRHAEDVAEFGSRARRYLPPTLADLLPGLIAERKGGKPTPVRAVHRLDKETSGLVVFARTPEAERDLGRQFRAHSTERLYLALVRGKARSARIESWLVRDRGDGRRGSGAAGSGQHAVTHVRLVEELGDFSLVECRLETGRTHQVRIHLGEAGTPLCGERVYDRPVHGRPAADGSGATRVMLHAVTLGFTHPGTGRRVQWTCSLPPDMEDLRRRLRRQAQSRSPRGGES